MMLMMGSDDEAIPFYYEVQDFYKTYVEYSEWLYEMVLNTPKYLHENRGIYAAYGIFDGLNLSLSLPKLYFDINNFNTDLSSLDDLHAYLCSWTGILVTLGLVGFSTLGSYIDDEQEDVGAWGIFATVWPYTRDAAKGGKWAIKAMVNLAIVALPFLGAGIVGYFGVFCLVLSCIAAIQRLIYRYLKEQRMSMQHDNEVLALAIRHKGYCLYERPSLESITPLSNFCHSFVIVDNALYYIDGTPSVQAVELENSDDFFLTIQHVKEHHELIRKQDGYQLSDPESEECVGISYVDFFQILKAHVPTLSYDRLESDCQAGLRARERTWAADLASIQRQDEYLRFFCSFLVVSSNIINGLYYYTGVLTLVAWSFPLLCVMAVSSLFFLFFNVLASYDEEARYQAKLEATCTLVQIEICKKEALSLLLELQYVIDRASDESQVDLRNIEDIQQRMLEKIETYTQLRTLWDDQRSLTAWSAAMQGLKNGLSIQGAISSMMLVCFLYGLLASPLVVLFFSLISLVAMIACGIIAYLHFEAIKIEQDRFRFQPSYCGSNDAAQTISKFTADLKRFQSERAGLAIPADYDTEVHKVRCALALDSSFLDGAASVSITDFDTLRYLLTGLRKGSKAGDQFEDLFYGFPWYVKMILSVVFALSLAGRSLAKNHGQAVAQPKRSNSSLLSELGDPHADSTSPCGSSDGDGIALSLTPRRGGTPMKRTASTHSVAFFEPPCSASQSAVFTNDPAWTAGRVTPIGRYSGSPAATAHSEYEGFRSLESFKEVDENGGADTRSDANDLSVTTHYDREHVSSNYHSFDRNTSPSTISMEDDVRTSASDESESKEQDFVCARNHQEFALDALEAPASRSSSR